MDNIIQSIKDLAQKASEDYLLFGNDLNDTILVFYQNNEIGNDEILKRICEQANQNVYLGLFNDEECNKSNIQFPIANSVQIKEQIQKSEQAMKDYQTPPDNFKLSLDKVSHFTGSEIKESEHVKLAELNELVEQRTTFRNFHNSMENLKNVEVYAAENSFNKMAYDAKLMIANGESIGDIAKIAMRYVKEQSSDMKKIAAAYDIIHKDLIDSGFHVKTGFTKTSSMKINNSSKVLEPVLDFTLSIEKIAAIDDICKNVSKTLNLFDQVIDKRIK